MSKDIKNESDSNESLQGDIENLNNNQNEVKRIADMEAKIIALENEIKSLKDISSKAKIDYDEKLRKLDASYQQSYRNQIQVKEKLAQEQLTNKLNELQDKYKKELDEAKKYAIKDQALELINIIVEFEKACNYPLSDPKLSNYQKGFKMFVMQFNNLLNDLNIKKVEPSVGQEFDANTMECFADTVKDDSKADNTIVEVIYPGYKLHDRLLKAAMVKVVKNK